MRILTHEFGGYAFIADLARVWAGRGHVVLFVYSGSVQTPQGGVDSKAGDPASLTFKPIRLSAGIDKQSFQKRFLQEREHGRQLLKIVERFGPDVVISSDSPSQVQWALAKACEQRGIPFVNWVQDLYGLAAYRLLRKKVPGVGAAVGQYFLWLDRRVNRASDAVVVISESFRSIVEADGAAAKKVTVIPNWAALAEIPVRPKNNAWAREHGLADKLCVLYSGTLAMKHNPELLLMLARRFRDQPEVRVVVVSEGRAVEAMAASARAEGLGNVVTMPFQPIERLPDVLGTADVLVAVLEPEAGEFSVPSKVLSYLCAQRPLALSVPLKNLAARTVIDAGAGYVAAPDRSDEFVVNVEKLLNDPKMRMSLAENGRAYAEANFEIGKIADRFEVVLRQAVENHRILRNG